MNEPKKYNITDIMLRTEFKFVVTVFLLLLAFTEYTKNPNSAHELCLWAVLFCFLGDILLMDYKKVPSYIFKSKHFYAGAASFAIGHIVYSQMFKTLTADKIFWSVGEWISLGIFALLCIFAFVAKLKKRSKLFYGVAIIYTCIILINLASAINCAIARDGKYVGALVGVICFVVSDFVLLIREVKKDTPTIRKLIWVFYPLAQILIILNV